MYSSDNKPSKPSFSSKLKQELRREDRQGRSYLLLAFLILLGIAFLFFLIALVRGCGGEGTKEVKTEEPAVQEEETGTEGTLTGLEEGGEAEETAPGEGQTYEVQSGDTLSSVGAKFGVDWKKIAEVNNLSAPYDLKVGDKLIIPPKGSEETSTSESGE